MEGRIKENPYILLEASLMKELDRLSPMTDSRCIHRVPPRLRLVREKAYAPRIVSIGPLHHEEKALKTMEEHKMRYLQYFLGRTNLSLMHYIEKIKNQEAELRSCYSETIELQSDEFIKIILVDAIFVIEYLFRYWYPEILHENDCMFGEPKMSSVVWLDLLMLENQLPFFILEDLFDPDIFPVSSEYSNRIDGVERISIMFLFHKFLAERGIYIGGKVAKLETISCSEVKVQHFVDLLRRLYIAPILKAEATRRPIAFNAPSIEELQRAGIQFKVGSNNNLFDIRFEDGILEIPKLEVVDSTEVILRNLVAFEQCVGTDDTYLSDYVSIMSKFLDAPKDVALLVEYGIVENWLGGNNELSTMIKYMGTGVDVGPEKFYYDTLCEDLNKYCSSTWNRRMANLRQNYFNTPWATISFIAAVLLLILTAIQTICSIISLL
ncbi:hypothetical protein RchiOBHm_Chr7g0203021 [Rosa chinensis]|uniref:Uncharacterized protein n=1 Tax=Rosa chinensis TaxID=74649 RepID=A0A2P6P8B4_ROSCH|nr:putative UPF0481 protein At3g02645 [Rosa chinensis]XP_040365954.1 putative UPF0481 protein At3g02645 [Rosa chinensis]PRQ18170.1 hypothetical protein RchiOBHm_Chr7g0203021 [Rosa chinensis]